MFVSKRKKMRPEKKNLPMAQAMSSTSLGPLFRSLFLLSWPEHCRCHRPASPFPSPRLPSLSISSPSPVHPASRGSQRQRRWGLLLLISPPSCALITVSTRSPPCEQLLAMAGAGAGSWVCGLLSHRPRSVAPGVVVLSLLLFEAYCVIRISYI